MSLSNENVSYTAYEDHVAWDPACPERNLMRQILRLAMEDLKKSGELYRDAKNFMLSEDESYLFSFLSICAHLDLCPHTVRRICGLQPLLTAGKRLMAA
ncbi:MAG: hypothetical protein KDD44_14255 [Bdellovibrionales bacterium]|nr:hypothetical protein [Bdellovibrionales bacterium]